MKSEIHPGFQPDIIVDSGANENVGCHELYLTDLE